MEGSEAGQDPAVAALLDSLLQEALAHVRPPAEVEREDEASPKEQQQRQAAEALLNLGDRLCTPEFRRAQGARWAPLALAFDRKLGDVLNSCADEEEAEYWDGDNSTLQHKLKGRLAAAAARVAGSLGCGGGVAGKVGQIERLVSIMARAGAGGAQLAELEATMRAEMGPVASTQRPALACDLARFNASWPAPASSAGGGAASAAASGADGAAPAAGAAVAEARCEVTQLDMPSAGFAAAAATFWPSGRRVALDPARELVWSSGGESRIKGFSIGAEDSWDACRYTLHSTRPELLGVLGGRVLAAAYGGAVDWWDIARLTPQRQWIPAGDVCGEDPEEMERKFGVKVLDMMDGCLNDEVEEAEATAGDAAHGQMQLVGAEAAEGYKVLQLLPVGAAEGDAQPQQVVGSMENSASVWVWDWPTGNLAGLLTGHTGVISDVSTSPGLPHLVAAGSYDGTCRIWDLRSPGPCTHVLSSKSSLGVAALALADYQGQPYCFSACDSDEAILCWDLRMRRCLYELATGITDVVALQWHSPTSSLFASTECDYIDRLGGRFNYGAMEGVRWPRCAHKPSDFPHSWDAGESLLVCYAFKEAPDRDVLPFEPEHDSEWEEWTSSDEEAEPAEAEQKAARHRARKAWRPRD